MMALMIRSLDYSGEEAGDQGRSPGWESRQRCWCFQTIKLAISSWPTLWRKAPPTPMAAMLNQYVFVLHQEGHSREAQDSPPS